MPAVDEGLKLLENITSGEYRRLWSTLDLLVIIGIFTLIHHQGFVSSKVPRFQGSKFQGSKVQGSNVPQEFQKCEVAKVQGSRVPGFQGFRLPGLGAPGFQKSKVSRFKGSRVS